MAKQLLKLLVAQMDQPVPEKDGSWDPRTGETTRLSRGDIFEALSKEQYDRLIAAGAALDPEEAAEKERADLEQRRAALELERDRIDAQLAQSTHPDELKGQALDDALEAAGLPTEGKADEKRARLAEHQASQGS